MFTPEDIISISSHKEFEKKALKLFRFQWDNNEVYQQFCQFLKKDKSNVKSLDEIPFLPIQFFKTHKIISSTLPVQKTFTSSGTSGTNTSQHHVIDLAYYKRSYLSCFNKSYGSVEDYVILALLPSYQEREGSSLIDMVDDLIQRTNNEDSGYYLNEYSALLTKLTQLDASGQNVILIGVTYALLDLIEYVKSSNIPSLNLKNTIIMETGGMKGKRKEMIREELHQILKNGFGVQCIHSEYGMTELLSQAYSFGEGIFECPPWMSVLIRDTEDPFKILTDSKTGGINVIDLANVYSCAFIATQDLGKKHINQSFEILGRFDSADIRGCNLMVL